MRIRSISAAATIAGVLLIASVVAQAAEVKVLATGALTGVIGELGPQFERATGHKLVIQRGLSGELKRQIEAGVAFDVVIIPPEMIDDLIKQGKIAAGTGTDIARVGMAVGVRAGAAKPDIGSTDAFKRALLGAKSITYAPEGATGLHLAKIFERLGIVEQMQAKTIPQTVGGQNARAVASGEAELGFGNTVVLLSVPGVELAGLFPPELQSWVVYTAGVGAAAKQPDAAKALMKHLATPDAVAVMKAKGLEPPGHTWPNRAIVILPVRRATTSPPRWRAEFYLCHAPALSPTTNAAWNRDNRF